MISVPVSRSAFPELTEQLPREVLLRDITLDDTTCQFRMRHYLSRQLVEELREHGQVMAVVLRGREPPYRVVDGVRRVRGLMELERECASACVIATLDDQRAIELSWLLNASRKSLSRLEQARAMRAWLEASGERLEKAPPVFGLKSTRQVQRYLALLDLPEVLQLAVDDGVLSMRQAMRLRAVEQSLLSRGIERIERERISVDTLLRELSVQSGFVVRRDREIAVITPRQMEFFARRVQFQRASTERLLRIQQESQEVVQHVESILHERGVR